MRGLWGEMNLVWQERERGLRVKGCFMRKNLNQCTPSPVAIILHHTYKWILITPVRRMEEIGDLI